MDIIQDTQTKTSFHKTIKVSTVVVISVIHKTILIGQITVLILTMERLVNNLCQEMTDLEIIILITKLIIIGKLLVFYLIKAN